MNSSSYNEDEEGVFANVTFEKFSPIVLRPNNIIFLRSTPDGKIYPRFTNTPLLYLYINTHIVPTLRMSAKAFIKNNLCACEYRKEIIAICQTGNIISSNVDSQHTSLTKWKHNCAHTKKQLRVAIKHVYVLFCVYSSFFITRQFKCEKKKLSRREIIYSASSGEN